MCSHTRVCTHAPFRPAILPPPPPPHPPSPSTIVRQRQRRRDSERDRDRHRVRQEREGRQRQTETERQRQRHRQTDRGRNYTSPSKFNSLHFPEQPIHTQIDNEVTATSPPNSTTRHRKVSKAAGRHVKCVTCNSPIHESGAARSAVEKSRSASAVKR